MTTRVTGTETLRVPKAETPPLHVEPDPDLLRRFTYHPPKDWQPPVYHEIRAHALALALDMARVQPPSRELSLAFTKLEEAVMWCNAGIARNT